MGLYPDDGTAQHVHSKESENMSTTPIRRWRRRSAVVAVAATAALILSACSAPTETTEPSAGASSEPRELSLAVVSPPNSLDPAQLVDGQQMFVWSSIYDTLLARENGTGENIPNAAESWEYNEDGTELTLNLREGMTFSNGDAVTADTVVATMERTMETPGNVQPKFSAVTDVTAADDLTVVIDFDQFDPQFLDVLSLGAGAIGDSETFGEDTVATDPIGSGPYTLDVAASVPGTSYVLTKRDDYWNADAFPFTTLKVTVLQDPTAALNAMQAGEINAATIQPQLSGQLDPAQYTSTPIDAQAVAYLAILDRAGESFPALGDIRVRQALNYAIDREGILTGILRDNGQSTEQVFSPFRQVFDPELNETYDYDPEKGRELVEEAGYEGTVFKIPSTFLTTAFEPALTQAFTDIGLVLEWVPVPPQQAQGALTSGEYGLSFQVTGFNSDSADAFVHYGQGGFANPRNYTDDTITELFEKINTTVDLEERIPYYQELNAHAVEEALDAPIAFTAVNWVTADGIVMLDDGSSAVQSVRLFGVAE
jgi:peptide/nickel transport system substrate-binding protein